MKVTFSDIKAPNSDALVIGVSESLKLEPEAAKIDKKTDGAISAAIKSSAFKGKTGDVLSIVSPAKIGCDLIIVAGFGDDKKITDCDAATIGGKVYSALSSGKAKKAIFIVEAHKKDKQLAANIALGAKLKSYRFDKYKTKEKDEDKPTLKELDISLTAYAEAKKIYNSLEKVADGVFLARDLVTEPPNKLYPESYANIVKNELTPLGATVKILNEKQLTKLGMGSLLGVGQGSARESYVVAIEYKGNKSSKEAPIAFVGKGVTFDTGGISIKPSLGMEDMKYDMGGSAAVVGVMRALAARKAKVNAVGVIGLVENMPGGNAQRPSDVVHSMSGQTIEVLNTDAEGRLVLADALWYTQEKYSPKFIIDLATLTGAIVIALGNEHAGIFSNSDKLSERLTKAGLETDEKVWRFPLSEAYDKLLESPIADMQNISNGRGAGSITAAQFLQRFIKDGTDWVHIDIAGMAWADKDRNTCPKGATAFGVRLLDRLVRDHYES